jgi:hypothetical protein
MRRALVFVAFAVAMGLALWGVLAPLQAQPTAILPVATSTTGVTTGAAVQIIGVNPTRRNIQICAFTNSINIAPVNPAGMTAVVPSATVGVPVASGACFSAPTLIVSSGTSGGLGAAFQAIGISGTASVTVLEY